jgi:hypothetical protein
MAKVFSTPPSLAQLKQALTIAEKIQALEADLADILSESAPVAKKGAGRGRPAGRTKIDVAAFLEAASGVTVAAGPGVKKRGRPVSKGTGAKAPKASKKTVKAAKVAAVGAKSGEAGDRKKRVMSEEGRQRIIDAQKKRWEAKRAAAGQ